MVAESPSPEIPDLDAAILPGASAAGIPIGEKIDKLQNLVPSIQAVDGTFGLYTFPSVKIWSREGIILQIGVSEGYRGLLDGKIGIGSTIAEVEEWSNCKVIEGQYDELVVAGKDGWSFETTEWNGNHKVSMNRYARITSIFVTSSPTR